MAFSTTTTTTSSHQGVFVGIGSTTLGATIGVIVGLTSGYLSGWVDLVFQRITDIFQALPLLVLALVMTAALGPSLPNVIIAPHIASATVGTRNAMAEICANNLIAGLTGQKLPAWVNPEVEAIRRK